MILRLRFLILYFVLISSAGMAQSRKAVTPEIAGGSSADDGIANVAWSPDGGRFVYTQNGRLFLFDTAQAAPQELVKLSVMEMQAAAPEPEIFGWENRRVRESKLQWFPGGDRLLIKVKGDLFVYPLDGGRWSQLTETATDEADPKLSPDGTRVSFRRGQDLYVLEAGSGKVRRLTRDGTPTRWNGKMDWVYPEELDLGTAHWWSPDSRQVAYLQFDVSREHIYPHVDLIPLRAVAEPQRYPKAGTPNASVRLGVVGASGGRTRWVDSVDGGADLLARVNWLPNSTGLLVQKLNRIQNRLALRHVPLKGSASVLLEETDPYWINLSDDLRLLKDGFLWSSESSGFRHLYRYSMEGELKRQLTAGDWEVSEVVDVDEVERRVYYVSTEATPLERHLYSVSFDAGPRSRITPEDGVHSIDMSPNCRHYIDTHSSMTRPTGTSLYAIDGKLAVLQSSEKKTQQEYRILPAEVVTVKAADGELLYGRFIRPAGFQTGTKYPAVVSVYGGPQSQTVLNSWSGADLNQALAQSGFVVWQLDNRGSSGRGHKWETKLYRRFGNQELEDQARGVEHLISMGFVDPNRIGIHGWSYGGFMSSYAMLHAPDLFQAGVAGAPVTDWRNYDTIYTERYLGLPAGNEEGYRVSSPVHRAGNLKGGLLLIHNIEDDNVLFQNTMQFAAELEKAGRPFEMMIYPQKTHGVTGVEKRHLYRTIADFFERRLKPGGGPIYDVVIYGGTSAGVSAAVQARRMGKSAILVGPDTHLGGLTSGGLGYTDSGNTRLIGGISREFYHRVWQHYQRPEAWRWQKREEFGNHGQGTVAMDGENRTMWLFEPHVAERIFEDLIAEHGIPVARNEWLDRDGGVEKSGGRIESITMLSGNRYRGRVFIDATYEGDLMAAAGVSFDVGREANSVYGERFNGVQKDVRHHGHFFPTPISPYVKPGDPSSGLVPRVHDGDPGENGEGDDRIQAYCFRMCLTTVAGNRLPFEKPQGYDAFQYELLARVLEGGWNEVFAKFDAIPNGKTDTNNHGPFSTDNIGMNYDYPEASYERRREILKEHEQYQKGLVYFLANDTRVPEKIRAEMSRWGLARDEFADNGNWPHQIYIRESRRMIGEYVLTENDCLGTRETPRSIGMGSYTADSHNVQRYVTPGGFVQNEGDVGIKVPPYKVSYGSIIPKAAESENLIVPVCLSSSHIAYGSVRMEPVFMILGQSAATAAALALDDGVSVQNVNYEKLRARLQSDGQILEPQ